MVIIGHGCLGKFGSGNGRFLQLKQITHLIKFLKVLVQYFKFWLSYLYLFELGDYDHYRSWPVPLW